MGMICCCDVRITDKWEEICKCDWKGWLSIKDWPPPRKNKNLPFALPIKDNEYLTRYQTVSGDHYEVIQSYKKIPRESKCGYTGKKLWLHWSGNDEKQPYAWRELNLKDKDLKLKKINE